MDCSQLTPLQVAAGYVTWLGTVQVLGIGLIAIGIIFLLRGFIAMLLHPILIEVVVWILAIAGLLGSWFVNPSLAQWFVPIGAVLFAGAMVTTAMLRNLKPNFERFCSVLFVVWGATALFYQDNIVGFMTVGALLALLGFNAYASPLMYSIGFKDEKHVPQATLAGFLMTAAYVVAKMMVQDFGIFQVFQVGALWLGSFVWFLGLLILSSKMMSEGSAYLGYQVLTIASYAFAITTATIWGVPQVTTIAGAFLILYVVEKIMEVPSEDLVGWGFKLIVTGIMLWFVWHTLSNNPELAAKFLHV